MDVLIERYNKRWPDYNFEYKYKFDRDQMNLIVSRPANEFSMVFAITGLLIFQFTYPENAGWWTGLMDVCRETVRENIELKLDIYLQDRVFYEVSGD